MLITGFDAHVILGNLAELPPAVSGPFSAAIGQRLAASRLGDFELSPECPEELRASLDAKILHLMAASVDSASAALSLAAAFGDDRASAVVSRLLESYRFVNDQLLGGACAAVVATERHIAAAAALVRQLEDASEADDKRQLHSRLNAATRQAADAVAMARREAAERGKVSDGVLEKLAADAESLESRRLQLFQSLCPQPQVGG